MQLKLGGQPSTVYENRLENDELPWQHWFNVVALHLLIWLCATAKNSRRQEKIPSDTRLTIVGQRFVC